MPVRYVPKWLPGAGWKRLAKRRATELMETVETGYKFVEDQMTAGKTNASYLSRAIESSGGTPEDLHNNKWTAASLFSGGADRVGPKLSSFSMNLLRANLLTSS